MPEQMQEEISSLSDSIKRSLSWMPKRYNVKFHRQYDFETENEILLVEITLPRERENSVNR